MTTVVLGWDGLDYDVCQRFGLTEAFGDRLREIDTIVNDELGKPHTWELWPSIITGVRPQTHGIQAHEYIESNWSNPLLRYAETLSKPIPDAIRWRVGRWLRDNGATMAFESASAYEDQWTIFDDRQAFPLAIPNYRSGVDERFDITADRGAELGEFMATETDGNGETVRKPTVAPDTFMGRITADAGEKIGLVHHAIRQDPDLVFVWLAYLDTAGHVAPTIADNETWLRDAYQHAASMTASVRGQLGDDDVLVCCSDHGLQGGEHTTSACVGSWPASVTDSIEHVLDIASALDAVTPRTAASDRRYETDHETVADVRANLESLGYVES